MHSSQKKTCKSPSIEYFPTLLEFPNVFQKAPTFPPKRDIYFYIYLVEEAS